MEQSTKRCDNLACVCDIPAGQSICSEYCGDAPPEEIRCRCEHAKCAHEMEAELTGTL
jgi:predicted nucleic acid-binding Zn ribbon protein